MLLSWNCVASPGFVSEMIGCLFALRYSLRCSVDSSTKDKQEDLSSKWVRLLVGQPVGWCALDATERNVKSLPGSNAGFFLGESGEVWFTIGIQAYLVPSSLSMILMNISLLVVVLQSVLLDVAELVVCVVQFPFGPHFHSHRPVHPVNRASDMFKVVVVAETVATDSMTKSKAIMVLKRCAGASRARPVICMWGHGMQRLVSVTG
jgi:hypothetical protein